MGCCKSCFISKDDELGETDPLLGRSNSANIISVNASDPVNAPFDFHDPTPLGSVAKSRQDEQSTLNGIISQYNNEVIDITALDSKIDAVEYMNRVQMYNRKVASVLNGQRYKQPSLYSVGPDPVQILAAPPVPIEDIILVRSAADQLNHAVKQIRVEKQQDLVLSLARK